MSTTELWEVNEHWVGLDVAKASFEAALVRPGQRFPQTPMREFPLATFPRTADGVQAFLAWLDEHVQDAPVRTAMEATGSYSVELAAWLIHARPALQPAIHNAHETAHFIKSLGLRNKTDGLDARGLALFGAERRPAPYEPLTPEREQLRTVSRYRDLLIRERVALENHLSEIGQSNFTAVNAKKRLRNLKDDIHRCEDELKVIVEKHPEIKHDVELLATIDGVAFLTAVTILAELGDLRRFARARQLTAYAGTTPRIVQSGPNKGKTRLCKRGNARARKTLYLSVLCIIRSKHDSHLKRTYQKLVAGGLPKKAAIAALMRKLLVVMRAMLIHNTSYKRNPHATGDSLTKNHLVA